MVELLVFSTAVRSEGFRYPTPNLGEAQDKETSLDLKTGLREDIETACIYLAYSHIGFPACLIIFARIYCPAPNIINPLLSRASEQMVQIVVANNLVSYLVKMVLKPLPVFVILLINFQRTLWHLVLLFIYRHVRGNRRSHLLACKCKFVFHFFKYLRFYSKECAKYN
jgi:hypothetical protein